MEFIRFENEELNKIIAEKLKKDDFTIEDISKISYISIDGKNINGALSQSDLDLILGNINSVYFSNINFENLLFTNASLSILGFKNCNLTGCSFENISTKTLELNGCTLNNNSMGKFRNISGITTLTLTGKDEIDKAKILSDYPDFDKLSFMEKINIQESAKYKKMEDIDLSAISSFSDLRYITLRRLNINSNVVDDFQKIKKLYSLNLADSIIQPDVKFPHIESLENLYVGHIDGCEVIENLNGISNLSINQYGDILRDSEVLANFRNLKDLKLENTPNANEVSVINNQLSTLSLIRCGISSIDFLSQFEHLTRVNLNNNNLNDDKVKDLVELNKNLVNRGILRRYRSCRIIKKTRN